MEYLFSKHVFGLSISVMRFSPLASRWEVLRITGGFWLDLGRYTLVVVR